MVCIHNKISNNNLPDNTKLLKLGCVLNNNYFCVDSNEIYFFFDILFASMKSSSIQKSFASLYLSSNHMDSACKLTYRLLQKLIDEFGKCEVWVILFFIS